MFRHAALLLALRSDANEVLTAVKNVNEVIAPKFFGKSVLEQARCKLTS